jgi:hypothetical protein
MGEDSIVPSQEGGGENMDFETKSAKSVTWGCRKMKIGIAFFRN